MRLVHLAPASKERGIRRAGLAGARATFAIAKGEHLALRRAVYAMPVVADFWTTFQWLRELRRQHDERMIAVYFWLADDDRVHVGRYDEPHASMSAAAAAAWVRKRPEGAEVVIPHGIGARDILRIRRMVQRVGWTETPDASRASACVCPACLGCGDRAFMRRVRSAYASGIDAIRRARSEEDILRALGELETPLERARGRIPPTKILSQVRSSNWQIRRQVAHLLGLCAWPAVEAPLVTLLGDHDDEVRAEAIDSILRAAGTRRAAALAADAPAETVVHLVESLELAACDAAVVAALERFARHADASVRAAVARAARAQLDDLDGAGALRERLGALA